MHFSLPHGEAAMALVGIAVWLAGLTLILVLKNHAERKGGNLSWLPLAVYLGLSGVALVVAGMLYRKSVLGGTSGMSKMPKAPKASKDMPKMKKDATSMPAFNDASLDSDALGDVDSTTSSY